MTRIKNGLTALFAVLMTISAFFIIKGFLAGHFSSPEAFKTYMETFGIFAPAMLVLIQALQVVLPVLPGFLGCIVGAGMFGAFGGFICNYIGISAGSIIAFLLARRFGASLVEVMIPAGKHDVFAAWLGKQNLFALVLFLAILLPLAPDDFLCYFSGLTKMSAKKFIWIIIAAKPWCILAYSVASANAFMGGF